MPPSSKNFSLVPTLLLSLALGVIFGVFFLLLFNPAVKRNAAAQSGQVQSGQVTTRQTAQASQSSDGTQDSANGQGGAASESEGSNTTQAATQTKVATRTYDYFTADTGAALYAEACQSCHMPGGKGATKGGGGVYNYPALAGNPKLASAAYVQSLVLNGNGGMPGFAHYLSDEQVAKIVNYVRTELNDNTDEVKPSDIAPLRPPAEKEMTFGESAG
ncbi:cytochrome c [Deinococcus sp. VB142]|uniref:Cytochrome c n=1 Tax=Deinococcus sp. VB142 TaxID=3112952 RepID=A0AAU6Q647_9DEIO